MSEKYLEHHGIKGMHWGVRKASASIQKLSRPKKTGDMTHDRELLKKRRQKVVGKTTYENNIERGEKIRKKNTITKPSRESIKDKASKISGRRRDKHAQKIVDELGRLDATNTSRARGYDLADKMGRKQFGKKNYDVLVTKQYVDAYNKGVKAMEKSYNKSLKKKYGDVKSTIVTQNGKKHLKTTLTDLKTGKKYESINALDPIAGAEGVYVKRRD